MIYKVKQPITLILILQGYKILATPLVDLMKNSKIITNAVATLALPWAHHMKYILGRSSETGLIGRTVHFIGYPTCYIVGRLHSMFHNLKTYCSYSILFFSPLLTFLITLLSILLIVPNIKLSSSNQLYNLFQLGIVLYIVTRKSKQLLSGGFSYLMAIGRRM